MKTFVLGVCGDLRHTVFMMGKVEFRSPMILSQTDGTVKITWKPDLIILAAIKTDVNNPVKQPAILGDPGAARRGRGKA